MKSSGFQTFCFLSVREEFQTWAHTSAVRYSSHINPSL
jgi:hypothetical protein